MTILLKAKSGKFRATANMAAAVMLTALHVRTADAREIKIATISAANSPWDHAMRKFAEETKKLSNGDLTVRVYTDAQLGNISKMLSSMQLGTLEMGYFGLGSVIFLRGAERSEEHTSELQSLMRISYAVFC